MAEKRACSEVGCDRDVHARGWCHTHYVDLRPKPECAIDGCSLPAYKRGWCNAHYQRWRNYGDPLVTRRRGRTFCSVEGCSRGVHGQGLCAMHVARFTRTGTTDARVRRADKDTARCSRCKRERPKGSFSPDPSNASGVASYCKPCAATRAREQRLGEPDRMLERRRRYGLTKRGLTLERYAGLLAKQGGVCAVCGGPPNGRGPTDGTAPAYHVDHDHRCCPGARTCGACIRGLLCHSCNVGLGSLGDDPERLRAAALYLESR